MTNEELAARGAHAESLLRAPEFIEAWDNYRAKYLDIIENSKSDDDALEARRMLRAGKEARDELERMVMDGAVATDDIQTARKAFDWRQLYSKT